MKKTIALLIIPLLFVFIAGAQTGKGNMMLGGNTSFEADNWGGYHTTEFSISPDIGYFFINNFAGGIRFQYDNLNQDEFGTYYSLFVGPFVRYYVLPVDKKVNLFVDGSYGFGSMGSSGDNTTIYGYDVMAGPAVFLTRNVALEFSLGFKSLKWEDVSDWDNTFGLNLGFQIHLDLKRK